MSGESSGKPGLGTGESRYAALAQSRKKPDSGSRKDSQTNHLDDPVYRRPAIDSAMSDERHEMLEGETQ
jgi:hypothetical protein